MTSERQRLTLLFQSFEPDAVFRVQRNFAFRQHPAGNEIVDPYAIASQGAGQRPCERKQTAFGRRIGHQIRQPLKSIDRTDIQNAPPASRAQIRRCMLAAVKRTAQIDLLDLIPEVRGGLLKRGARIPARIVHQPVDLPELARCLVHQAGAIGFAGDVGADESRLASFCANPRSGRLAFVLFDIGQDYRRALFREHSRAGKTNALRRPGDHDDFAFDPALTHAHNVPMAILHDGRYIAATAALLLLSGSAFAQPQAAEYSVTWNSPGSSYKDSMPIGNGDIGLNVWTEANGDIVFLIAKTDAWTENGQLVKLGRVRLSIDGNPFKASPAFRQILRPKSGDIELRGESSSVMHVWVDANAPAIHIEMRGAQPVRLRAAAELWRTEPRRITSARGNVEMDNGLRELSGNPEKGVVIEPDTVLPADNNQLAWLHFNLRSIYPSVFDNQHLDSLLGGYPDPLLHRAFGVLMKGPGLASAGNQTLRNPRPRVTVFVSIYTRSPRRPHRHRIGGRRRSNR